MEENSKIFERILQIIAQHGIESVNIFATKSLGYNSAEKIYRLKKSGTTPSFDILADISNKFDDIDMNWFITGKGQMLKKDNLEGSLISEPVKPYQTLTLNYKDAFDFARVEAEHHREMNKALLKIIEDLQKK